jgi:hypothetical protein
MMIKKLFIQNLYIKVSENKFSVKNLSVDSDWESLEADQPFTTRRLLVGNFSNAEAVLTRLMKRVAKKRFFARRPQVVIHPLLYVDGGLSEIEERVFRELALSAGAFKVVLHIGSELTDSEAVKLLSNS